MKRRRWKETLFVRGWSLRNVFFLWLASPSIVELSERRCVVRIPLNWRTRRRDIRAMYLGTLCMGADIASGLMPFLIVQKQSASVSIIFKAMNASFLKRAEGDVLFTCEDGDLVSDLVRRTLASGEREEARLRVTATVPDKLGDEPVAAFEMTLSMKKR